MENARLITETREALEQQTATAEVLQVINSSPGDLAPVFDAMVQKAMRLCGAAHGALRTFDGEALNLVAMHGDSDLVARVRQTGSIRPQPGTPYEPLVRGNRIVHVVDARDSIAYQEVATSRERVDVLGIRTFLAVALSKDGKLLGALSVFRREVRPFSEKEIALLENFAAQAVIAMDNARLLTETREALEQQTATAEILRVIASSAADVQPVFSAIAAAAVRLTGASLSGIVTYDGSLMHLAAMSGITPEEDKKIRSVFPIPADHATATGRAILTREVAHIEQMPAASEHTYPTLAQSSGQTVLAVPMLRDGVPVGAINVQRRQAEPFTDKQIELFKSFADQAVIAMENARLLTETREALEHQTATSDVLGVINSSPGNLAPVFDAMLEKAVGLCGAAFGAMMLRQDERFIGVAVRGMPEAYSEYLKHNPPAHGSDTAPARILQGERFVHIVDLAAEDAYRMNEPRRRALVDLGGARSHLSVPLRKDGTLLGMISCNRGEVRPFSEKEIALLENFAAQAVIAMENARLITETREALEQQTATAEVLQVINSSPGDLAPVFDAILEKAHTLCGAARGALVSYDGKWFRAIATRGLPEAFDEFMRRGFPLIPSSPAGQLARGEHVHILDFPAFAREGPPETAELVRPALQLAGTRTLLMVPLCKDGGLLGYIAAYRTQVQAFTDKQIALLQNFAAQAVIAMENARLLGELRQRTEEVDELNRGLEARVAEQVDELGRVGRLKRFLAPQLAELIVSHGDENILESHRREIVVVFCDLRGYTAFTETAEPEEVLDFLREYHGALGPLVSQFEGTLDQFSGDGIMVFFNDPVPCPDPAERAVKMAMAMREASGTLIAAWRRRGRVLGFGAGIAQGYATLGQIGFADRSGYTAIGTVCNLAARLCAEAKDGQILVAQRVAVAVEEMAPLEEVGELTLKGLTQPVVAFNVPLVATQPALRVIDGGGPQSV
jgi:GAF domain-containing protein